MKEKIAKTNAARLLDKAKVSYELIPYEVDENDLSAIHVAASLGENIEQVFKTLVLHGDKTGHFVCVIPGEHEVDLKLAAKVSGNKKCDLIPMLVLGNLLAAQGAALMDELMQGVLSVVAHWLGPDTAIQMAASYAGTPAGVTDGSAAIAVIGGADGPTAIFVTSRYNAQALWGFAVKVFSNVLVIVLNYVFSKLIIFKNRK